MSTAPSGCMAPVVRGAIAAESLPGDNVIADGIAAACSAVSGWRCMVGRAIATVRQDIKNRRYDAAAATG